ncbi:MAG: adenylate kinase family protein [Candidatus Nanohalobium sp.]
MKITLTGTPGTGKTTVSRKLAEEGFEVVHLTQFLEENDIGEKVKGEREVRVNQMVQEVQEKSFEEDTVIEGHLAHHVPADICIVLRCRPDILEERLSKRSYTDRKVEENIESEKIDIVLSEAVQKQEKVVELDTTDKNVEETVEELIEKVEKREEDYGEVDWTTYI